MPDPHSDELDGYLFRLWCRAASYPGGRPGLLAKIMRNHGPKGGDNQEPHHYRAALMEYARQTGVNLPSN
ncbi:MAG: hypothetical protein ACPGFA_01140 [Pikeienuella sp.]